MNRKSQVVNHIDQSTNLFAKELPINEHIDIGYPKFLAKLSCGLFGISDDFIEKYQSLDRLFIKNKFSTFFFESTGDSMEPTIYAGQIYVTKIKLQFSPRTFLYIQIFLTE